MEKLEKTLKVIMQAIEIEKYGYDFYTSMRMMVKDPEGVMILSKLAMMELDHAQWLEDAYLDQLHVVDEFDETLEMDLLLEAKEKIFLDDPRVKVFRAFDAVQALDFAIDVEKKSVAFYRDNQEIFEDTRLKELFSKLVDFEAEHIGYLTKLKDSVDAHNSWKMEDPVMPQVM